MKRPAIRLRRCLKLLNWLSRDWSRKSRKSKSLHVHQVSGLLVYLVT
jgi:hypothetical protein